VRNRKLIPNENYARELMELFTLGVYDAAGNPTYTQDDVAQIARAFTGWDYDNREAEFIESRHDFMAEFPARGPKVIFKDTGGFGPGGEDFTQPNGEGPAEIDRVVDIIFEHRDSAGKKTVARRIAQRLLEFFAHPDPPTAVVDAVIASPSAASSFETTWDLTPLLRAIFVHDEFYATMGPPFAPGAVKSVKWPVDYVVSTMRLLGMRLKSRDQYVEGGDYLSIFDHMANMGQLLLDPPSVFGWDWETAWISSSTLLARYRFARDVTSARDGGSTSFRPDRLLNGLLDLTDPDDIVNAVKEILDVSDQLSSGEHATLVNYLTDGGANPTLDLYDYDVRNRKLHGLFALVLQSPAYQLH
jgi:uncharacterized protein (DUF1800 family)